MHGVESGFSATPAPNRSIGSQEAEPAVEGARDISSVLASFPMPMPQGNVIWWPPDVFAITARLLNDTESFRFAVSPPDAEEWPPEPDWADNVRRTALEWVRAVNGPTTALPPSLIETWSVVLAAESVTLDEIRRGKRWDISCALLTSRSRRRSGGGTGWCRNRPVLVDIRGTSLEETGPYRFTVSLSSMADTGPPQDSSWFRRNQSTVSIPSPRQPYGSDRRLVESIPYG